jgi:uncharacterized membrane protein YeaQ/YmgE (transglycosylase-associated protein family)
MVTALIGILGAFIGGWVLNLVGFAGNTGSFGLGSILTATLGAIILLAIYRLLTRRAVCDNAARRIGSPTNHRRKEKDV